MKKTIFNNLCSFAGAMLVCLSASVFVTGCGSDSKDVNPASGIDGGNAENSGNVGGSNAPLAAYKLYGESDRFYHSASTEAVLYELNSNMQLTKREFSAKTKGSADSCSFEFEKLELESPYALVKVSDSQNKNELWSFVDLSRLDTVYVNYMTFLESQRVVKLMKDGLPADSAERVAQAEILKDLFGVSAYLKPSNKMKLSWVKENTPDDYYFISSVSTALSLFDSLYAYPEIPQKYAETGVWETDSLKTYFADHVIYPVIVNTSSSSVNSLAFKFAKTFFSQTYSFGSCTSGNKFDYTKVENPWSFFYGRMLQCDEKYGWILPNYGNY